MECQSFPWSLIFRSLHTERGLLPSSSYSSNSGLWKLEALIFVKKPLWYLFSTFFFFKIYRRVWNLWNWYATRLFYATVWITYHALGHLSLLLAGARFPEWKPDELLRDVLRSVSFLPSLMCNRFICVVQGLSVSDEFVLKSQTIPHVLLEMILILLVLF